MKKSEIKSISAVLIVLFLSVSCVFCAENIAKNITHSIETCLTIIIPSLFCYMVISTYLVKSNLYILLAKPFKKISERVFHIRSQLFPVFIISQFGGYPIGAKLLCELRKDNLISDKEASEMLCYCYAPSPTFVIGISLAATSSIIVSMIIYASVVASNVIIALISGIKRKTTNTSVLQQYHPKISIDTLISSISSGANSLFKVCVMIIVFSVIIAIYESTGLHQLINQELNVILKSFIEISNISFYPIKHGFSIAAGVISTGGLCTFFQILSIVNNKINIGKFIIIRIIAGIMTSFLTYLIINFFSISVSASSVTIGIRNISPVSSILLIIMTICTLFKKTVAKTKTL